MSKNSTSWCLWTDTPLWALSLGWWSLQGDCEITHQKRGNATSPRNATCVTSAYTHSRTAIWNATQITHYKSVVALLITCHVSSTLCTPTRNVLTLTVTGKRGHIISCSWTIIDNLTEVSCVLCVRVNTLIVLYSIWLHLCLNLSLVLL